MASLSMRANAAIFRPAAAAGRRQALRAPAGLGGMLPLRRASTVRVASASSRRLSVSAVSTPIRPEPLEREREGADLSAAPPFTLADIRAAIPDHCWERNAVKSMGYLIRDVAIVLGLAAGAFALNNALVWPIYWLAQGTMFWALFVIGHDCGHRSFSANNTLNDFVGNIVHSSILVPYHGWRVSHRTHHSNHGHVENDESWHPTTKALFDNFSWWNRMGRLSLPLAMLAFPAYLFLRSPGKTGSHFDPNCELFVPQERTMVLTSNACLFAMLGVLGACAFALGPLAVVNLYVMPYIVYIMWLDTVTYLHHHGEDDQHAQMPWYRGAEWSYLRGGLTTLDRDFGIFNKIHHNIETHVVHHLFPQIPHYNLVEATEAVKPVMGEYYREPVRSKGPIPFHLLKNLVQSFKRDHYVADTGDVVFYQKGF